jgi:hydroxyacylglutathione hydrolase
MTSIFIQIRAPNSDNFVYLVEDEKTGEAMIVDPPSLISTVTSLIKEHNAKVRYIVNTHGHRDHTSGNVDLARSTGGRIAAHINARQHKDVALRQDDVLMLGDLKVEVLHTPGHSSDSICLLIGDKLLTGDTLFVGECGRTDLPGGDAAQLYESLFEKIARLEDHIRIYPGHNYGATPWSTLESEKKTNYALKPRTLEEFIEFMSEP